MIKRNLLMNNAISRESFSKFLQELSKRSDNTLLNTDAGSKSIVAEAYPAAVALVVDAICLWEAEKWRFLTMADNARLNPESHVFPNSMPASVRL